MKNFEAPLEDVGVTVGGKRIDNSGNMKTHVNVAKTYEVIKRHYGRSDNNIRFLTYKRGLIFDTA